VDHPTDLHQTLELIAQHGSAKEVILVVQESLDALLRSVTDLGDEDSSDEDVPPPSPTQIVWKWINLIEMYTLGRLQIDNCIQVFSTKIRATSFSALGSP
jgi:hypothetical protein